MLSRKNKKALAAFLFVIFFSLPILAVAQKTYITDLRVIRKPHHWQFVFESTASIHYKYRQLNNPRRVVFEMPNVHLRRMVSPAEYVTTPVTKIHMRRRKNILRITLDLDHKVVVKPYTLAANKKYPYRLVIDLKGRQMLVVGWPWSKRAKSAEHTIIKQHKATKPSLPIFSSTMRSKRRERNIVVVIDPGHGGKDPGATGFHGYHEKNIVLAISKDLQRDINQLPGFKAVLTRTGDYFIPLRGRLAIARRDRADMFIAIHADAYKNHTAHGVSVFALSQRGATGEAARWLAKRENRSELIGGVDLGDKSNMLKSVLINLSQTATVRTSLQIGEDLVQNIGRFAHLHHGYQVEQAAFVVLKSPDIPSLLVETGFISNRDEERRLVSSRYQNRLARAMTGGISEYFRERPPRGTQLAQRKHYLG